MNLVAPHIFLKTLGVLLNYPPAIGVGYLPWAGRATRVALAPLLGTLLAWIRPSLDVCTVDGDGLTEAREFIEHTSSEAPKDVLDFEGVPPLRELGAEAREGRLAWNVVRRVDATKGGDVWIVVRVRMKAETDSRPK